MSGTVKITRVDQISRDVNVRTCKDEIVIESTGYVQLSVNDARKLAKVLLQNAARAQLYENSVRRKENAGLVVEEE